MDTPTTLRRTREARNLTLDQAAQQLGITQSYMSLLERRLRTPSGPLQTRIQEWLKEGTPQDAPPRPEHDR